MTAANHKDREAYVHELDLDPHAIDGCGSFYTYVWPAEANGTKYDRFVVIEEFSDGSCAIYLSASDLGGVKARCVQLREMVQS